MSNVVNNKDSCLCLNTDGLNLKNETKSDEESIKSHSKKFDFSAKERSLKGLVNLKQSFRTLTVPKRTTEKDKNEPSRFLGDGVTFKAKLIGILEVEEARGDRMCQEALFELKMAVRAAGEHKQRINIVIAIDGIRLRDEKTGDCLYHHPVHKISFIAQDVADSRAFGYIFGSPDTGHRFFGIKTDKAASQVVMAMRDLFQAVYELKKREVEMAKQNIEQHQMKYGSSFFLDSISASSSKNGSDPVGRTKPVTREDTTKNAKNKTQTAGVIADLMDLELELNSLQQGLSQMERLTPSDPFGPSPSLAKEDPFGDSFTPPPCITTPPPAKLPPPPASGDRRKVVSTSSAASQPELHWFDKETQDLFSSEKNLPAVVSEIDKEKKEDTRVLDRNDISSKDLYDVFTELDPLGTGRSKPYIDKKDFFQELKNPPKRMLKDLVDKENADGTNVATCFAGNSKSLFTEDSEKLYDEHFRKYNSVDSEHRVVDKSDTFYESGDDPFDTGFANFAAFEHRDERRRSPMNGKSPSHDSFQSVLKSTSKNVYKPIKAEETKWSKEDNKQKIVINLRKVLSNADDTDKENDSPVADDATVLKNLDANSPACGDVSSDSFESIPEPPPRPITSPIVSQPPPLPPKKLQLPVTMKPPPKPSSDSLSHYDYIENYESLGSRQKLNGDVQIPPLPAPARKPKFGQDVDRDFGRHRPAKQSEQEYYLTPITKHADDRVKPSLNITLSQLTSTGFEDLAAMLRIPSSKLSKMTLKELTECLSRLSDADCQKLESDMSNRQRIDKPDGVAFKANFEDKFPAKASQAAQIDKYAVFRELIEQEEKNQKNTPVEVQSPQPETPQERDDDNDDKYAALRTIVAPTTDENAKECSEKEDSASEVILPAEDSEATESACKRDETDKEHKTEPGTPVEEGKTEEKSDESKPSPETELCKNWAKFDTEEKEAKVSRWQENKEEYYKEPKAEAKLRYKKRAPRKRWNDDEDEDEDDGNDEDYGDDSEENWESSKKSLGSSWDESSWRENGWSDRDSLYDDAECSPTASYRERRYQLKKKGYRRKYSPHKKSDEHSPWDEEAEWSRKPYKEYKDGAAGYDERKIRTPPWPSDRKRYGEKEEDDLALLKMMLGKKRLKALEEQLFKRYQNQLSEPAKKSYYYLKNASSKECDNDYADAAGKSRYAKKYYTQRPKSADKGRKTLSIRPDDGEELFLKKYRRPYSHDELSISEEERWSRKSPTYKKPSSCSRNQSQTSPFEDNFSPQSYEYADASETHKKNARYMAKKTDSKRPLELHAYSAYDFKSGRSSRESSQRQSPFEDDFTPPDVQKSERGSDVSKDGDRRDDEVFFSAGTPDVRTLRISRTSRISRYDHKRTDRPSKHYENVEVRKKTPDLYYDKIQAKDKYKYCSKDGNGETCDLKSPKKKHANEVRRHDPFNDNQNYESKTMPRLQKAKSKSKMQYDSGSDSAEGVKWKDDLASFTFNEQHSHK